MSGQKSQISRDTYKKIKAFNREQMEQFIGEIYREAEEQYREGSVNTCT